MKQFFTLFLTAVSCFAQQQPKPNYQKARLENLFSIEKLNNLREVHLSIANVDTTSSIPFSNTDVVIWDELILLFDPSSFDCGCDEKVKNRIKKAKIINNDASGFVPSVVTARIKNEPAYKIGDFNQDILMGSFRYKIKGSPVTESAYVGNANVLKNARMEDYINGLGSSFLFTNDCSGYVSAATNANIGLSAAQVESSIKAASNKNISLVVIQAYYNSPIYLQYKNQTKTIENLKWTCFKR